MLKTVIYDLRIFMLFYTILIGLFCQVFAVMGLGNLYPTKEDTKKRMLLRILKAKGGGGGGGGTAAASSSDEFGSNDMINAAAKEYKALGLHIGEFMWTLRLSLGDGSAIEAAKKLETPAEHRVFWIMWLIVTIVTCVIFLNFIVAEASASYVKVTETLE
jgi:hypothetical protein